MARLFSVVVAWSVVATALAEDQGTHITKTFKTNNGFGVASVAGVTSRNGRVSSISGVNFFPSGTNPFYFQGRSGEKMPEPISFSKEEDGKFTAGEIKYGPGSVSVTSVARSIYPDSMKSKSVSASASSSSAKSSIQNMFMPNMFMPRQFQPRNTMYQDPFSVFNSRSLDPWFPNTYMFRQPSYQSFNSRRPSWSYANFNPLFDFWRR